MLGSLVLSKLVFGAGAWPPLKVTERQIFAGALFSLYRSTLGLRRDEDQHITLATMCSLLGLPDHESLLKIEQLRYARQLCCHAPDEVWALIRRDGPYLTVLRDALTWLFVRVCATSDLPDPLVQWDPWCTLMKERPQAFKGLILRAKGLELCRATCYAALQALYRALRFHGEGRSPVDQGRNEACYTEACIPCRKGFASRAAWACHASKLHGYRIAASVLAGSQGGKVCLSCGTCFSKTARLRRHLLHSAECRVGWGSFVPDPASGVPTLHDRAPPITVEGLLQECHAGLDPARYNKGLLEALLVLEHPSAAEVWARVVDFIEPLEVLRYTVRIWGEQTQGVHHAIVEDVVLMLDPELLCDIFCKPKHNEPVAECFPELPGPLTEVFPFVLSGEVVILDLDTAPCPSFCYPFVGGAPLSAAKRQANFVAAACDTVGHLVQLSMSKRVLLRASRRTLASLEPMPSWLVSAGFTVTDFGISSPTD